MSAAPPPGPPGGATPTTDASKQPDAKAVDQGMAAYERYRSFRDTLYGK
jgi:hypothetical protein